MTKDFEIVVEKSISIENIVESSFVNVGWGSYETQFKGSAGKKEIKDEASEFFSSLEFLRFYLHLFSEQICNFVHIICHIDGVYFFLLFIVFINLVRIFI